MKPVSAACLLVLWAGLTGGCATDGELSQRDKDRIERDMARQEQKRAQEQAKMLREANPGSKLRNSR